MPWPIQSQKSLDTFYKATHDSGSGMFQEENVNRGCHDESPITVTGWERFSEGLKFGPELKKCRVILGLFRLAHCQKLGIPRIAPDEKTTRKL